MLPIPEEGAHFTFSSGAGAWSTDLTLFPDGTFSGKFHDRDMDITYLCQFQGVFSMLTPLDSRTWSLTLTDLEVTTGHPEGTETSFVSTSPALLRRIFPRAAALGAAAITGCLRRALFSLGTACVICGWDTASSPSPDHPAPFSPLHFF